MSFWVSKGYKVSYIVVTGILTAFLVGVLSQTMGSTMEGIFTWGPLISVASTVGVYLCYRDPSGRHNGSEDQVEIELHDSAPRGHREDASIPSPVILQEHTSGSAAQPTTQAASTGNMPQSQYEEVDLGNLADNTPLLGHDNELRLPKLGGSVSTRSSLQELPALVSATPGIQGRRGIGHTRTGRRPLL